MYTQFCYMCVWYVIEDTHLYIYHNISRSLYLYLNKTKIQVDLRSS